MPNPAMLLTRSDLTAPELSGANLSSSLGDLARTGASRMSALEQAQLNMQQEELGRAARERMKAKRQGAMADVLGMAGGGLALGLGASGGLASLVGNAAGSFAGQSPHSLVTGGLDAAGGLQDLLLENRLRSVKPAVRS